MIFKLDIIHCLLFKPVQKLNKKFNARITALNYLYLMNFKTWVLLPLTADTE